MTYTIQLRRDDAADWTSVNPILHDGEFGWERDTGKFKIGDGVIAWNSLPYTSAVPDTLVEALGDLSDVDLTGAAAGKILGTDDGVTWGPIDPPASPEGGGLGRSYFATVSGVLALSTGTTRLYNDTGVDLTIQYVRATYNFNVTGTPIIVDLDLDGGTTMYTTQANRPTIAVGTQTSRTTPDVVTWAAGHFLTLDVDGIGSSPPVNGLLLVQIEVTE